MAEPLASDGRLPIRMLHDRILVKVPDDEGERRSTGGILIPPTAQVAATRLVWGEALATGNHVRVIEVGDQVLFSPEDPNEVEVQGALYLILRERDAHALAAGPDRGVDRALPLGRGRAAAIRAR